MNKQKNLAQLKQRLEEAGLSLDIYKNLPSKYVRINPRSSFSKKDVETETGRLGHVNGFENVFMTAQIKTGEIYQKGGYHIQDLASMVPILLLNLKKNESFLDLCAAPGLKSALAFDTASGIKITCVEKDRKRFTKMLAYFRRYGIHASCFCEDGMKFKGGPFDKALADVPCSGEGMVTKFDDIIRESTSHVKRRTKVQVRLLQNGFRLLKENGLLVYSTCTLNKYENEQIVQKFLRKNPNAVLEITKPNIEIEMKQSGFGLRIIPGETRGGFATVVRKVHT